MGFLDKLFSEKKPNTTAPLVKLLACQWSCPSPSKEVTELIRIITTSCKSTEEKSVSRCLEAIDKLAKGKDPIVSEVLCYAALVSNHSKVSNAAACDLKEVYTPEITQILGDALHYDRGVQGPVSLMRVLKALEIIGDSKAIKEIAIFLDDFCRTWKMKGDTIGSGMDMLTLGACLSAEQAICLYACRTLAALGSSDYANSLEAVLADDYWGNYSEIREELPELIAEMKTKS